jgi:aquaporin Z
MAPTLSRRLGAEALGTAWLVFGGCGSAVFAAKFLSNGADTGLGIGFVGVSLAFGLTVLTMAYAIGHISGCHLNPAVTIGQVVAKRFPAAEAVPYIVAQVVGAIVGGGIIYVIAKGVKGWGIDSSQAGAFATNGFGNHSPGGYRLGACLVAEVVLTFVFLMIILGATDKRAPAGFAPIAIGLGLTLIHLISIPITNTSVNPARSTGVAVFTGGTPLAQLWLFWLAPIVGAVIAGVVYPLLAAGGSDIATPNDASQIIRESGSVRVSTRVKAGKR